MRCCNLRNDKDRQNIMRSEPRIQEKLNLLRMSSVWNRAHFFYTILFIEIGLSCEKSFGYILRFANSIAVAVIFSFHCAVFVFSLLYRRFG